MFVAGHAKYSRMFASWNDDITLVNYGCLIGNSFNRVEQRVTVLFSGHLIQRYREIAY